ncbi:hypothetical protein Nepgr_007626 [Nepenthes gracilis]|uniref:C2 domain-containing protein n=1 Tax=Nepenthes gracilis TaxID=150966 RepID=A0AAD3S7K9_NEPGR|nr:hypothetical protein Nepgr_007626 [Nepenthes gracilis]
MHSPQSVVSPFKNHAVVAEPEKQSFDAAVRRPGCLSKGIEVHRKEVGDYNIEDFIGVLDVYIHQARDIHNICIYHKQDVYAKLCLTSNPEDSISTQIINGGGKNPIFNENIRLKVRTIESSLKCEIWMLSRVRNYLEDQLLGFSLVPLSEVVSKNGKLEKEFSLSSTDLVHSPAGFVHLSVSYSGASPEVMEIPKLPTVLASDSTEQESEIIEPTPNEFDKIEFPDPKILNENQMMVSEYFGISCASLKTQSTESLPSSDTETHLNSEITFPILENFSANSVESLSFHDSPSSSMSTNRSASVSLPASSQSSDSPMAPKSPTQELVSPLKEKKTDVGDTESRPPREAMLNPLVGINFELEGKVVQQDIVDMYMKSMQQFTESLAKMKLPMDLETEHVKSVNSSSDQKLQATKNPGSRVFYGSRAFF